MLKLFFKRQGISFSFFLFKELYHLAPKSNNI